MRRLRDVQKMDLTDRQLKHLEEIFNFFDHDKNGNVDRREVQMAFRSWGQDFSHEEVSAMIREFDVDGDGFLSFQEFVYMINAYMEPDNEGIALRIRETFKRIDVDQSGTISMDELIGGLQDLLQEDAPSVLEITQLMDVIDVDQSGEITLEEFTDFVLNADHEIAYKLLDSLRPSPLEIARAFQGMPKGFRQSELAKLETKGSHSLSKVMKPIMNPDGLSLKDAVVEKVEKCRSVQLHMVELRGVPLPAGQTEVLKRRVRMCFHDGEKFVGNWHVIEATYNPSTEDEWHFSTSHPSNNVYLRFSDEPGRRYKLMMEFCVVLRRKPMTYPMQSNASTHPSLKEFGKPLEVSCGHCFLDMGTAADPIRLKEHVVDFKGGTLFKPEDIPASEIRATRTGPRSALRFFKNIFGGGRVLPKAVIQLDRFRSSREEKNDSLPHPLIVPYRFTRYLRTFCESVTNGVLRRRIHEGKPSHISDTTMKWFLAILDQPDVAQKMVECLDARFSRTSAFLRKRMEWKLLSLQQAVHHTAPLLQSTTFPRRDLRFPNKVDKRVNMIAAFTEPVPRTALRNLCENPANILYKPFSAAEVILDMMPDSDEDFDTFVGEEHLRPGF